MFRVINESTRKPVDDPALKALRERAVTRLESGALLVTRDKQELPVEHCGAPIVGFDGSLAGAVLIFRDVTERRRTAQRQSMLVGELNHRVKNALAIVQSLVQASLRQATSAPAKAMAETLAERLQALHRAHDLLLESQWSGASLKAMVEREMDPYRREGGPRIMIKGPDVLLPPQCTSILAMTLHELATNAVKYGALSQNSGQLAISWKSGRGNRLLLTWEERATLNRGSHAARRRLRHAADRQGHAPQSRRRHQGRVSADRTLCRAERAARAVERAAREAAEGGRLGLDGYSSTPISSLAWRRRSENSRVRLPRMVIMMFGMRGGELVQLLDPEPVADHLARRRRYRPSACRRRAAPSRRSSSRVRSRRPASCARPVRAP